MGENFMNHSIISHPEMYT